jgi:hypothetical protein
MKHNMQSHRKDIYKLWRGNVAVSSFFPERECVPTILQKSM